MNVNIGSDPAGRRELSSLTSIRFLFSLGVVLFHLQYMWIWPTTDHTQLIERARLGVDMFFVLSGFVLSYVYMEQVEAGLFDYRRFLIARFARVYPAHLVIVLAMVAVALAAMAMRQSFDPADYSVAGLLQTLLLVHAWFPTDLTAEWNGPSWSLSAEWGAYLLFPVFAWLAARLAKRPMLLLAAAAGLFFALDAGYRAAFGDTVTHAEFNMGVLRILPSFLAGMALHLIWRRTALRPPVAVAASVGTAALLALLMHLGAYEPAIIAAAALLILALAFLSKAGADGPLAWRWLVFLGEASYAIYLIHMPTIVVWKNARSVLLGGESSYVLGGGEVAALVLTILAGGCLVHALFERPARLFIRRRWLRASTPSTAPAKPRFDQPSRNPSA
jgi:peptidoglycan/LPS O-acetylase OafA/YrhL